MFHPCEKGLCWRGQFWYPRRSPVVVAGKSLQFMSQHRSLRAAAGTTGAKRNVLKRFERVAVLKSRGQWKDGERVTGLRKTIPPV